MTPRHPYRQVSVRTTVIAAVLLATMQPAFAGVSVWSSISDGFWDVVGNWLPSPPASGDQVHIEGPRSVTYRTGEVFLGGIEAPQAHLIVEGGTLVVEGPTTLDKLSIRSSEFNGLGTTTVNELSMQEGYYNGFVNGLLRVQSQAFLDGATNNTFVVSDSVQLMGQSTWSAGDGRLELDHGNNVLTRVRSELVIGSAGTLLDEGASSASGVKTLSASPTLGRIRNEGTFVRTGEGTTAVVGLFDNAGKVQVQNGTLIIGRGTQTGQTLIDQGATLSLRDTRDEVTFAAGSRIVNEGTFDISGLTTVWQAGALYEGSGEIVVRQQGRLISHDALHLNKLTLQTGSLSTDQSIHIKELDLGGTLSASEVNVWGHAKLSGGVYGHLNLYGTATLHSLSSVTSTRIHKNATLFDLGRPEAGFLTGMDGMVINEGLFKRIEGAGTRVFHGEVINSGTFELLSGMSQFDAGFTGGKVILAGGSLSGQSDIAIDQLEWRSGAMTGVPIRTAWDGLSQPATVVNGAALLSGAGLLSLSRELTLFGNTTWDAGQGSIDISGAGLMHVRSGATFRDLGSATASGVKHLGGPPIHNYRFVLHEGSHYVREGLGQTRVSGLYNKGTISVQQGELALTGELNDNVGRIHVANGSTLRVNQGQLRLHDGDIAVEGDMHILQAGLMVDGGLLRNAGQLHIEEGAMVVANGHGYDGEGLLHVGRESWLHVQNGLMKVNLGRNEGTIDVDEGAVVETLGKRIDNAGTLAGSGTFIGDVFSEDGRIRPGQGMAGHQLTIEGNLILGNASVLEMQLDSGGLATLIDIQGLLTLDGTLTLDVADHGLFQEGQEFVLLQFDGLLGDDQFDSFQVNTTLPYEWSLIYGSDDIRVRIQAVPEAGTLGMMSIGLLGLLWVTRRRRAS